MALLTDVISGGRLDRENSEIVRLELNDPIQSGRVKRMIFLHPPKNEKSSGTDGMDP